MVFLLAAAATFYLAYEGGGYDIVVRQTAGLLSWTLLAAGLILGWLPRAQPSKALLMPALAALGLVAWTAFAFTWTESAERTTAELARLLDYLGIAALVAATIDRNKFPAAAAGITAGAVAIAVVAVVSRLFPDAFPEAGSVAALFSRDRLDFPLDYWNAVGAWTAMTAAICLGWSAHLNVLPLRASALAVVPLAGTCTYLTYSRGGAVGTAMAVLAVLVLSRNRWTALVHSLVAGGGVAAVILTINWHEQIADATGGEGGAAVAAAIVLAGALSAVAAAATGLLGVDKLRIPRPVAPWAVGVGAVIALLGTVMLADDTVSDAWDEFNNQETVATGAERLTSAGGNRINLWEAAIDGFEAEPLTGTGPGTYEFWWSRDARHPEYVRNAHSLYLESMSETGLPGLLLLVAMLAGLFGAALYARRRIQDPVGLAASVAMSAAYCVFLVNASVDWIWQFAAITAMALGGLVAVAAADARPLGAAERRRAVSWGRWRPVLLAVAVIGALIQVPGLMSTDRIRDSQEAARAGDLAGSLQLAEQAVKAMPWAATAYEQRALVQEARGELAAAQASMGEAIANEPTNWRYPLALARIQAKRGARAAAIATFEKGRRLRPHSPSYSPFSPYGRAVYTEAQLRQISRERAAKR